MYASTGDLHFETTLLRYPEDTDAFPERSELNAAACHSEFERHVASLLDQVPGALVLVAEPDIDVQQVGDGKWALEVKGFDSYNPATGQVTPHEGVKEIECLMIDTNYDGATFFGERSTSRARAMTGG